MARITYYTATATRQHMHEGHYQCSACGFASAVRCWAQVSHSATSTRNDPEYLGRQAAEGAESKVRAQTLHHFEHLWCPRCGQRSLKDTQRLGRMAVKNYIGAAISGAIAVAMLVAWAIDDFTGIWSGVMVVCGIAAPLFLVQALKQSKNSRDKALGVPQPHAQFAAAMQPQMQQHQQQQHPQQPYPGYPMPGGQRMP